ncbi:MAG TPA: hypothetical protein VFS83_01180 [Ktedonobacterales bacterium]|nr:hypothetical protein [Ktedonobacterales bacterium]
MSAPTRMTPRTLRLSVWLYRRLLVAYPRPFRREYGAQMVQVFRDCCREATASDGAVGLLRYWLLAFGDLIVSALAERRREELHMTRTLWIRVGSLAAIIGGGIATIFAGISLIYSTNPSLNQHETLGSSMVSVQFVAWVAPALALLFVLALIGVQARGASRARAIGWISITVAVIGMIISSLGSGLTSALMYSQADTCNSALNCNVYDPSGYLMMGNMVGLLGTVISAIGMVIYGIIALRRRVLPRGNWLLLAVGITGLLDAAAAAFIGTMTGSSVDAAGLLKVAIILSVPALAVDIAWILLGIMLWPRGDEEAPAQNVSTPVEPAI